MLFRTLYTISKHIHNFALIANLNIDITDLIFSNDRAMPYKQHANISESLTPRISFKIISVTLQ